MDAPLVYIIIPTYNEESRIGATLADVLKYNFSAVVVDDGSSDRTINIVKELPVTLIKHPINRGQGAALATGTAYALNKGANIIVHFDADGQFLAHEIKSLIEPLLNNNNEVDIILGSRFINPAQNNMPWLKKKIIHPASRLVNNFITGIKLTDVHCGFRALNRQAAEKIIISQDGMAHSTEIISQIKKNNLRYLEKPVTIIYHEFGQGISGGFKILKDLVLKKIIN